MDDLREEQHELEEAEREREDERREDERIAAWFGAMVEVAEDWRR